MGPVDIIVILVIALIVGGATAYIIKQKKNGARCIGCPDSKTCAARTCTGTCQGCPSQCAHPTADDTTDSSAK